MYIYIYDYMMSNWVWSGIFCIGCSPLNSTSQISRPSHGFPAGNVAVPTVAWLPHLTYFFFASPESSTVLQIMQPGHSRCLRRMGRVRWFLCSVQMNLEKWGMQWYVVFSLQQTFFVEACQKGQRDVIYIYSGCSVLFLSFLENSFFNFRTGFKHGVTTTAQWANTPGPKHNPHSYTTLVGLGVKSNPFQ